MELRAMDLAEVRNLVKWLDEQQRKSRQEAAVLQQQFAGQQREMADLARRLQEMEGQLPTMQAQITRLAQVDQQMENLKAEIVHIVEQNNDKRIQSEKEMERLRQVEQEATKRTLTEIREMLTPVPRLQEEMEHRRAEDERLSASLAIIKNEIPQLAARLDERVQDVTYLEEGIRQDGRRIAELQQGLLEAKKRADEMRTRQINMEDLLKRNEAQLTRLAQGEQERRQEAIDFIEQSKLAAQRQQQQLDRWGSQLDEFQELMAGYAKQWRVFEEQHRLNREASAGLVEFRAGLERRQQELAELQRVENERMKQQWNTFLADDEKREHQRELDAEQWAKEQLRQRDDFREQFSVLQRQLEEASQEIRRLFTLQEKYADAFRQFSRIWMEGYESVVTRPVTRKVPG